MKPFQREAWSRADRVAKRRSFKIEELPKKERNVKLLLRAPVESKIAMFLLGAGRETTDEEST